MDWTSTLEFNPIGGTWYFRINATGEIAEVSVSVSTAEDWAESPKSKDSTWRTISYNQGIIIAVKVLTNPPCDLLTWREAQPQPGEWKKWPLCDPPQPKAKGETNA